MFYVAKTEHDFHLREHIGHAVTDTNPIGSTFNSYGYTPNRKGTFVKHSDRKRYSEYDVGEQCSRANEPFYTCKEKPQGKIWLSWWCEVEQLWLCEKRLRNYCRWLKLGVWDTRSNLKFWSSLVIVPRIRQNIWQESNRLSHPILLSPLTPQREEKNPIPLGRTFFSLTEVKYHLIPRYFRLNTEIMK